MSISEHFRYQNDVFQSDIFVSDIDVGCRISPTLRSMSMPTYGHVYIQNMIKTMIIVILINKGASLYLYKKIGADCNNF
jgi:hypothetical protein